MDRAQLSVRALNILDDAIFVEYVMPEPRKVLAGRTASDHKKTFFEILTHRRKAYRTARD